VASELCLDTNRLLRYVLSTQGLSPPSIRRFIAVQKYFDLQVHKTC
jgi:hypothetical protein